MATTETVHAEGFWKNKQELGVVPHCTRWSGERKSGKTSEDNAEVNCTRCARQLGFAPAPRVSSSTRGTCQCCFGSYETRQKGGCWEIVLHGYQRPGIGYLLGECRGHGHVPYEVSCERTESFRAELARFGAEQQEWLAEVVGDHVRSFTASVATGERVMGAKGYMTAEYKSVEVPRGQGEVPNPFQPARPWEKVPSYATLRDRVAAEVRQTIAKVAEQVEFLAGKVAAWEPVPFPRA